MDNVLNVKLIAHPLNWLIVWVVVAMAGFAVAMCKGKIGPGVAPYAPVA